MLTPDQLAAIASRYTNYAMIPDGIPEINSLANLPFEAEYPPPSPAARLALVLIEPRLLDPAGDGALRGELLRRLRRFKGDLRAEGLHSRLVFAHHDCRPDAGNDLGVNSVVDMHPAVAGMVDIPKSHVQ